MTTVTVNTAHLDNSRFHLLQKAMEEHGGELLTVRDSITTVAFGSLTYASRFRDDARIYGVPATLTRSK